MYKVLQIDGGGIRGIIPATVCANLERMSGKPINKMFDLITGTSTGAILGGALACGAPARSILDLYVKQGQSLFTPRPWYFPANWIKSKYDRAPFMKVIMDQTGLHTMSDLPGAFMATAWGQSAGRTHFIKSWDKQDAGFRVSDVIAWSALSAIYYFGPINVPGYDWMHKTPAGMPVHRVGETFEDGGEGGWNCTLQFVLNEILARDLDESDSVIVSLGCGELDGYVPYETTRTSGFITRLGRMIGGARGESSIQQVLTAEYIASMRDTIKVIRVNTRIGKDMDALDSVKYTDRYAILGDLASNMVPSIISALNNEW